MNKDLLMIEIIFIAFLLINSFVKNALSIKILFIFLLLFYILKSKSTFVYNKSKFVFISYSLIIFSILFLLTNYVISFIFIVIIFCLLVLFLYLKYVLFRYSYGTVIKKTNQKIFVKVDDCFYKKNKIIELITRKKVNKNDIVIFSLENVFLQKKQKKVISIRKE
jgi:hypothetical protein